MAAPILVLRVGCDQPWVGGTLVNDPNGPNPRALAARCIYLAIDDKLRPVWGLVSGRHLRLRGQPAQRFGQDFPTIDGKSHRGEERGFPAVGRVRRIQEAVLSL